MSKPQGGGSFFETIARFVVDRRNLIFFLYIVAAIFSVISSRWVGVDNDITDYLSKDTETRKGLTLMDDEMTTFGTARIMVSHVTYDIAYDLAGQIEGIDGVSSAKLGDNDPADPPDEDDDDDEPDTPEDIADYMQGANALITVTFDGEEDDDSAKAAMQDIRTLLSDYDAYISTTVGVSQADTLAQEMTVILAIAAVIIVLVLLITSRSYAELPVMILTFASAALLNMGTNFWFGTISFISNSVTVVLQLALAIDYAIILLHRFTEERQTCDTRQACINAVSYSIPAIASSSLTTISGLGAMLFMQFGIGPDMAMVLIKAICFSMLSVFTLMPGLLMLFANALVRTQHREFLPKIDKWGRLVVKLRYIGVPVFLVALVAGFILANRCPYVYGDTLVKTTSHSEQQIADHRVDDTFGAQNVAAVLVPRGDYEKEKRLLDRLERYDQVDSATGLANIEAKDGYCLTDKMTPRQFSEMTDVSYESVCLLYSAYAVDQEEYGRIVGGIENYSVPLMDMFIFLHDQMDEGYVSLDDETEADVNDMYDQLIDGQKQMLGENYSRLVLNLDLPEEGQETFAFLKTIHQEAERYYPADQVLVVGNATSNYDLSTSFARDNVMISVLSVAFVILILLFTFQSVGLPILLILVIQGSIWINYGIPTITNSPLFFLSYLVVSSIQMGANIDYAIVTTSRFMEFKDKMPKKDAIIETMNLAFPTIITSGLMMVIAGILIGQMTSNAAIAGIGDSLGRGTIITIIIVMFILPQILLLGEKVIDKTSFDVPTPVSQHQSSGRVRIDGMVRGEIRGQIHGIVHAYVDGDVNISLLSGQTEPDPGEDTDPAPSPEPEAEPEPEPGEEAAPQDEQPQEKEAEAHEE